MRSKYSFPYSFCRWSQNWNREDWIGGEVGFFCMWAWISFFFVKWAVMDQTVTDHVGAILLDCLSLRCYMYNMGKYYSGFCFFLILCVCVWQERFGPECSATKPGSRSVSPLLISLVPLQGLFCVSLVLFFGHDFNLHAMPGLIYTFWESAAAVPLQPVQLVTLSSEAFLSPVLNREAPYTHVK